MDGGTSRPDVWSRTVFFRGWSVLQSLSGDVGCSKPNPSTSLSSPFTPRRGVRGLVGGRCGLRGRSSGIQTRSAIVVDTSPPRSTASPRNGSPTRSASQYSASAKSRLSQRRQFSGLRETTAVHWSIEIRVRAASRVCGGCAVCVGSAWRADVRWRVAWRNCGVFC